LSLGDLPFWRTPALPESWSWLGWKDRTSQPVSEFCWVTLKRRLLIHVQKAPLNARRLPPILSHY
jgi:hypothetical protein